MASRKQQPMTEGKPLLRSVALGMVTRNREADGKKQVSRFRSS